MEKVHSGNMSTTVLIIIRDKSVRVIKVFLKDKFLFSLEQLSGEFLYTDYASRTSKITGIDEIKDPEILESPWIEKIKQVFQSELKTLHELQWMFQPSQVDLANETTSRATDRTEEEIPPHVQRELNPENS